MVLRSRRCCSKPMHGSCWLPGRVAPPPPLLAPPLVSWPRRLLAAAAGLKATAATAARPPWDELQLPLNKPWCSGSANGS